MSIYLTTDELKLRISQIEKRLAELSTTKEKIAFKSFKSESYAVVSDYINSYEEEDNAYETIHNIAVGTETLSITFKDGSVVIMDAEGSDESFTVEDVRLAKVDDEDQGFLFNDPEHQISEKTGVASQFNEICQGFETSYDVYQFARVICDF